MNGRERVLRALDHLEPDRVPTFHRGESPNAEVLRLHLGSAHWSDIVDVGDYLSWRHPTGWVARSGPSQVSYDEFGIGWRNEGYTSWPVEVPLGKVTDRAELNDWPWPDPWAAGRTEHLRAEAQALRGKGQAVAVMTGWGGSTGFFEQSCAVVGWERFLELSVTHPLLAEALLDKMLELLMGLAENILRQVGDLIDIVCMGDDLGMQQAMIVSPGYFRRVLKPRRKLLIDHVRHFTAARVYYHSCGAIEPIIGDLVEIGVQVLDPIQPRALDTAELKRRYGDRLTFFGGIDEQHTLPFGTPEDVRREVRQRFREMGQGGGLILGPAHWLLPDTPWENVVALYDEARRCTYG
jgi:uroporphyrinogen decarboxylase